MRKVIIGFSRPKHKIFPIFSWLIRFFEGTDYSHTYVKTYSQTADTWLVYQASGSMVNFMGEKHFINAAHIAREFEFEISENSFKEYLKWAILNAGVPYGLKTVLGILIARVFNLKKNPFGDGESTLFCAELCRIVLNDFIGVHVAKEEFELAGLKKLFLICERTHLFTSIKGPT